MKISGLKPSFKLSDFSHQITHEFTKKMPIFASELIHKNVKNLIKFEVFQRQLSLRFC